MRNEQWVSNVQLAQVPGLDKLLPPEPEQENDMSRPTAGRGATVTPDTGAILEHRVSTTAFRVNWMAWGSRWNTGRPAAAASRPYAPPHGAVMYWVLATAIAFLTGCTSITPPARETATGPQSPAPGDHSFTLQHGGLQRRYHVHIPIHRRGRHLPVMLALHGGGGSGRQFQRENALDPVADRERFLAVYPDGTGPLSGRLLTWNAGEHCCGWAREHAVDDSGFLLAVLDDLATRTAVDQDRIYVTGHSNGAMMAYRFASEHADRVSAVIPVAGAMDLAVFSPTRPVAVLHIHSMDDPRALYAGGLGPPFPGTHNRVAHQPVARGLAQWAAHNGCDPQPRTQAVFSGSGRDAGQTVTHLVYTGCRKGGAVELLRLSGSGHGWPGVQVPWLRRRFLGASTTLVNASEQAWKFAARFSRAGR